MKHSHINEQYISLCKSYGLALEIAETDGIDRWYHVEEQNGIWHLQVHSDLPGWLSYDKALCWGVREVLLPRLVLETERLCLRRFQEGDIHNCLPLLSHEADCYRDCSRYFTEKDSAYYERVQLFLEREMQYAVILKSTDALIGTLNVFEDRARAVDALEIGYSIAHEFQRNGYATEMLAAMLALLQDTLQVELVSAGVLPDNEASIALLKKLGFCQEGIRHHAAWHEGLDKPVDLQYFYKDRV